MAKTARRKTARKKTKRPAKKAAKKPEGSRAKTVAWAAKHMKKKPDISMSELKKLGKKAGHHIYPLIMGLARKELGWASAKKKTRKKAAGRVGARRGPGRPPKSSDPTAAIQAVIARMRELEREADALRKAMSKIASIAGNV